MPAQQARPALARAGFAVVTAALLLSEIALTRVFSATIGYYFAFMSISVAMLGLGAGSLWVTLRGEVRLAPDVRAGRAAFGLAVVGALAMLAYLRFYPLMGDEGTTGQIAYVALFGALFAPFLVGGVLISTVFEAGHRDFARLYAIDLLGAAVGCVVAVVLLDHVQAPTAMMLICLLSGAASPLFFLGAGRRQSAIASAVGLVVLFGGGALALRGSWIWNPPVIRNQKLVGLVLDQWNDFSRVIVRRGPFYTWGLSETYQKKHDDQYDLLIEGVAGTQIQQFDGDLKKLDFFSYDVASLPHLIRPKGSALVLGVGAGFDVMMAKYFDKAPVVGVEVNPLVGRIVNEDFGAYSGRPYHLPDVTINFENARTFVKRDTAKYDVVTVTWVDSGAATGAGAFALTENYLYTVEAFRDYLSRTKDDGVLAFMRARYSPEYDAIKGIGIAIEAMRSMGIAEPEKNVLVTSVKSPHFGNRELTHVMLRRTPFTAEEIARVDEARKRLHLVDLYTPGRNAGDAVITRLVTDRDRPALYASFPFDIEPTTDDRPFYFFLRASETRAAGGDVQVLRKSLITIFVLIGAFLLVPLVVLMRRMARNKGAGGLGAAGAGVLVPTVYFALLGLGFMLIEMKLLQQSVLIVGNPTLSLAAVLSSLLLSTGAGALLSQRIVASPDRARAGAMAFGALLLTLLLALGTSEGLANILTGFTLPVRTLGLVFAIAPLGLLLGCPLPLGMATLGNQKGLVAWCWGINGLFGVAGSGVAIYVAIHHGLRAAFLAGVGCYFVAAAVFLVFLSKGGAKGGVATA
jgi:predicted membrane-bound spermidine synthase